MSRTIRRVWRSNGQGLGLGTDRNHCGCWMCERPTKFHRYDRTTREARARRDEEWAWDSKRSSQAASI